MFHYASITLLYVTKSLLQVLMYFSTKSYGMIMVWSVGLCLNISRGVGAAAGESRFLMTSLHAGVSYYGICRKCALVSIN